jgi:hypothetical protein
MRIIYHEKQTPVVIGVLLPLTELIKNREQKFVNFIEKYCLWFWLIGAVFVSLRYFITEPLLKSTLLWASYALFIPGWLNIFTFKHTVVSIKYRKEHKNFFQRNKDTLLLEAIKISLPAILGFLLGTQY